MAEPINCEKTIKLILLLEIVAELTRIAFDCVDSSKWDDS